MLMHHICAQGAWKHPDLVAVTAETGDGLSWAELDARAERLADALHALGVRQGDRVACILDNCLEMVVLFFASSKLGAIYSPINSRFVMREKLQVLEDLAPKVLISRAAHGEEVAALRATGKLPGIGAWPLIMGVSMFLQQKINPQPADPMQARIMMMLPIIFTFILARFPSGLVIYWAWNNTLSIAQQWVIMKRAMAVGAPGASAPRSATAGLKHFANTLLARITGRPVEAEPEAPPAPVNKPKKAEKAAEPVEAEEDAEAASPRPPRKRQRKKRRRG